MKRILVVLAAGVTALSLASCKHAPPANVAAEVNGHAITNAELDRFFQQQNQQNAEQANEDQLASAKLELLNGMITSEIIRQRPERLGLTARDADVEAKVNQMNT